MKLIFQHYAVTVTKKYITNTKLTMKQIKEQLKIKRINFKLSERERCFIDSICKADNKTISQLIRDAVTFYGVYHQKTKSS